jgi:multidrug efflux pump subunit AcrA (membrane-fusion protein)
MIGKPVSTSSGASSGDGWGAGGYIRFGTFCVLLLAGGLGGWAATAKLKGAVVSSGHLRVESQRQVVQHPDGGVVGGWSPSRPNRKASPSMPNCWWRPKAIPR